MCQVSSVGETPRGFVDAKMAGLIHQLGNSSQQATVPPQSAAERATRSVFGKALLTYG